MFILKRSEDGHLCSYETPTETRRKPASDRTTARLDHVPARCAVPPGARTGPRKAPARMRSRMSTSATTKAPAPEQPDPRPAQGAVDRYFRISERGSTLPREIRGGFATFFAMAYIIVLNPII